MSATPRRLRADAARNRSRVLKVAYETFAEEGLAVPVDEIARRAGVGAGTVYRHFPTKEALFAAIAADRMGQLVDAAGALADADDAGEAFFGFLFDVVRAGRRDQGLVDALAGSGFDLAAVVPDAEREFLGALGGLLERAQRAGAVRPDVTVREVKTLLVGCQAMQRYTGDAELADRLAAVVRDGLTARPR